MKNKLLLFLVIVVLGILPAVSFAETTAPSTIKSEIDAKKEAIKNSVEERRQNAIDKIKERVDQFTQNVIERFEAANSRLEKLADRIDSRIVKMEAKNVDTSEARAKIEAAKASVALITTPTDTTLPTTVATIKKDFEITKTQIQKAKDDIKAAHAALVDVVNNLLKIKN